MKKPTLTLLAMLVLTLTGCGKDGKPSVKFVNDYNIYTDTIRGHVYLHVNRGGILHDPDCPCMEKGIHTTTHEAQSINNAEQ